MQTLGEVNESDFAQNIDTPHFIIILYYGYTISVIPPITPSKCSPSFHRGHAISMTPPKCSPSFHRGYAISMTPPKYSHSFHRGHVISMTPSKYSHSFHRGHAISMTPFKCSPSFHRGYAISMMPRYCSLLCYLPVFPKSCQPPKWQLGSCS